MNIEELKEKIEDINESKDLSVEQFYIVEQVIEALDKGAIRVAEPEGRDWVVNEWIKKSILLLPVLIGWPHETIWYFANLKKVRKYKLLNNETTA